MALNDGIRRNIATVSKEERDRFRDAILALAQLTFPGLPGDPVPGGVSYWFKQDEIHDSTHVHYCPAFFPWHRELMNRFEGMLRGVDPALSLHYWDWTQDPRNAPDGQGGFVNLFTPDFMGSAIGATGLPVEMGAPFDALGRFYGAAAGQDRDAPGRTAADPPLTVVRQVGHGGALITAAQEAVLLAAPDFVELSGRMQGTAPYPDLHGTAHSYIGGTIRSPHTSFRDPFVFLLHSNVDRLFAMWQRQPGHPERVDPAQVYRGQSTGHDGYQNTKGGQRSTIDPPPMPPPSSTTVANDADVDSLHPWWGILSPLEPWSGPGDIAQTAATGIIAHVKTVRPWVEAEAPHPVIDSRDPSVVRPPSYDTVPHSSYFIFDRDTFSENEAAATPTFAAAFTLIYDGYTPNELGGSPPAAPAFAVTFDSGVDASGSIAVSAQPPALENASGLDVPQRITFPIDVHVTDPTVFTTFTDTRTVHVRATHGSDTADGTLELLKQPNPYMVDGDPSWLSTDVRVFRLSPGGTLDHLPLFHHPDPGSDPAAAATTFIQGVITRFNGIAPGPNHPFELLSQDQQVSQLELNSTIGTTPVFNYAVAKVRYRASMQPASNVQVFFRAFTTMRSALDYSYVAPNPPQINYPRSGTPASAVPLLGTIDGEVGSIPFFAVPRVNAGQPVDTPNVQTLPATGADTVTYFGCWLDINQPTPRFPSPAAGPGLWPIPQLIHGHHQCLVAEIRFQPGASDPIPSGSTPASSDRLAQRNLAIAHSDNPGNADTHTVAHTFTLKPSAAPVRANTGAPGKEPVFFDELMIRWNDVPSETKATLFVPEWDADEILALAAVRQHPQALHKVDAHTLAIDIADVGFVPIPGGQRGDVAALMTLELPQGVKARQVFHVDVRQYSRARSRFLGGFRIAIPVGTPTELLPLETRRLALLRYMAQAVPPTNRWHPIYARWLDLLALKVRGLGGDPDKVPASLSDPAGISPQPAAGGGCFGLLVRVLRRLMGRDRDDD